MEEKEPPWRAELRHALHDAGVHLYELDHALTVVIPHIQAAEQRGRREALAEAAARVSVRRDEIRSDAAWSRSRSRRPFLQGMEVAQKLIDPDTPESP